MKKTLLALAAAALAVSANAADYYLVGTFNGWTNPDPNTKFTETTGGNYELDLTEDLAGEIKITPGNWSESWGAGSEPFVIGETYTLNHHKDSGNINLGQKGVANPHIVFNPEQNTLKITGKTVDVEANVTLAGEINSWNGSDSNYKFTSTDGKNFKLTVASLAGAFKIVNNGVWYGKQESVEFGTTYTLDAGGEGNDLTLADQSATNITLNFNVETAEFFATAEGGDPNPPTPPTPGDNYSGWYLNVQGDYNSYKPEGVEFGSDGTAVVKNQNIGTGEFEIKIWNGKEDAYYSNGEAVKPGVEYILPLGGGSHMTVEGATATSSYDVYFDAKTNTMKLVSLDEPTPPTPPTPGDKILYLVGGFNGWGNPSDYKFTQNGNVYTLELEDGLTGEWKITDGTWDWNFGAGDAQPESGVEVDAWFLSGSNFNTSFSGKTTIVFTLVEGSDVKDTSVASKIKVTAEGTVEPDPVEEWYVSVLGIFNDWKADGVHPDTNGKVEFKALSIGDSEFKIKVYNGLADAWYSTGDAVALDTDVVIAGNSDANMTISGASEDGVYDVTFNVLTNTMKITKSSSTLVEVFNADGEAVYFNLQGARVANAENGVFIRVVNGKAEKVIR